MYLAPRQFEDCKTNIEKLFWIINSRAKDLQTPEELGQFAALARASEYANYKGDKLRQYMHDIMNAIDYEVYLHESHERGYKVEIAKALLSNGISIDIISQSTGLSISPKYLSAL